MTARCKLEALGTTPDGVVTYLQTICEWYQAVWWLNIEERKEWTYSSSIDRTWLLDRNDEPPTMTWELVPLGLCVVTGYQGEAVWADLVPVDAGETWELNHIATAARHLAEYHEDARRSAKERGEPFSIYGATVPGDGLGAAYWELMGYRRPEATDCTGAQALNRRACERTGESLSDLVGF